MTSATITTLDRPRGTVLASRVSRLQPTLAQLIATWPGVFEAEFRKEAPVTRSQAIAVKEPVVAFNRIHDAVSVICVGSFNPAIFHPAWLAGRNLIQKTEEAGAEVQAVTPDASAFKIKWLQLQVLRDRFVAATETPDDSLLLRDLVVGAFRLLEHTPVSFVGLNRHVHFQVQNEKEWHHVGHVLAPKRIWQRYLTSPGLSALTIKAQRPDKVAGEINIQVNASPAKPSVIEVSVNNHFVLDAGSAAAVAAELISDQWDEAMRAASDLAEKIVADALKEPVCGQ